MVLAGYPINDVADLPVDILDAIEKVTTRDLFVLAEKSSRLWPIKPSTLYG